MKLIKQLGDTLRSSLVKEDAAGGATGGGAVGAVGMPLFAQLVQRTSPKKKVKVAPPVVKAKKPGLGLAEAVLKEFDMDGGGGAGMGDAMGSGDGSSGAAKNFDSSEIISKLKGLENKEKVDNRDTTTFGLEDEDGNLVRVTVKAEQAEDFERTLQAFMMNAEQEEERTADVAEILFKLKDQFDIVDVQWPDIEEDAEEVQDVAGAEGEPGAEGMDPNMDPNAAGGEMDLDGGMEDMGGGADTSSVEDLLTQVIDMMKADAEARKAEARAREAEAKTKEANARVDQSMARVKQEEQYLDMESFEKAKKEEEKEAKRLARLAKWKHDMGGSGGDQDMDSDDAPLQPNPAGLDSEPEEEERVMRHPPRQVAKPAQRAAHVRGRLAPHDIAQFIIDRVK